jgi:hypothetical protein
MPGVVSYKVGVTRSHKRGPSRWLSAKLEAESGGVQTVAMFFYEGEVPSLGFLNRETNQLVANLPAADFDCSAWICRPRKSRSARGRSTCPPSRVTGSRR